MLYKSKRTAVNIFATLVALIIYVIIAAGEDAPAADNLQEWAILMLTFVLVAIAACIILQIIFHLLLAAGMAMAGGCEGESVLGKIKRAMGSEMREDEMEKLITLKTSHLSHGIICVGMLVMLIVLAFSENVTFILALHILLGFVVLGELSGGFLGIYYQEKGV